MLILVLSDWRGWPPFSGIESVTVGHREAESLLRSPECSHPVSSSWYFVHPRSVNLAARSVVVSSTLNMRCCCFRLAESCSSVDANASGFDF